MFSDKNWIPYALIIIMGLIIFILWQANEAKGIKIAKAKEVAKQQEFNTIVIQEYNQKKFDELDAINKSKWSKGKHHGSF